MRELTSELFYISAGVKEVSKPADVTRRHAFRSRNWIGGIDINDKPESEVGGTQRFCDVCGLCYRINPRFNSFLCFLLSFVFIILYRLAIRFKICPEILIKLNGEFSHVNFRAPPNGKNQVCYTNIPPARKQSFRQMLRCENSI